MRTALALASILFVLSATPVAAFSQLLTPLRTAPRACFLRASPRQPRAQVVSLSLLPLNGRPRAKLHTLAALVCILHRPPPVRKARCKPHTQTALGLLDVVRVPSRYALSGCTLRLLSTCWLPWLLPWRRASAVQGRGALLERGPALTSPDGTKSGCPGVL
ncbi:MAG: hypothetical protein J3K34DRAFT_410838 [Monoraphidium minutum]|nr:MAG: hypothetical protein J3K34DRAFT_410838 [Monoraphidium minutum]